ncbi:MAG: SiaB family protein kinase [Bacteroidales bacterium]|nr:SiaB family protein kinase [Bacteroidales bacterium]
MSFDLNTWYKNITNGNVLMTYQGEITADLITNVLSTLEDRLELSHEDSKVKKKVYNVLVESLQNLYHHIDEPPSDINLDKNFAIFVVARVGNGYKISTGNFVKNDRVKMIKDRIDQINYLNKIELKSLYKLILNNEEFSPKGGGGLGMIDIARKSGNKLEYDFVNHNQEYSFFSLNVVIAN